MARRKVTQNKSLNPRYSETISATVKTLALIAHDGKKVQMMAVDTLPLEKLKLI